jgi:uncharacterized repeat protein (TIGR03803 family)
MRSCHTLFRCALLGSALAIVALTPAMSASASREDMKRVLAVKGIHAFASKKTGGASGLGAADATYTDLHDFSGSPNDGANSSATVTLDDAGNIYGTTDSGGANGDGTVFKLTPGGTQTLLHSFNGDDGSAPDGGVVLLGNGTLYGTAGSGGASENGVIFQISKKGKYKVLHDFAGNDGSFIRGDLIRDKLGNLYGTALFGGANDDGTVYKYGFDGSFTVLHAFNGTDGEFPEHGVVSDKDGNLYGVTAFGGATDNGSVYKIAANGTFSTLYSFTGGDDGGFLYGGLDIDNDGNIYGSTADGGANAEGTVFKLTPGGTLTTLYSFTGGTDGGGPEGDMLVVGKNLYSTTTDGGDPNCGCGTIYEVTSKGKAKVLHAFVSATGAAYSAGLTSKNKVLYGTAGSDGLDGDGVVFSVTKK